MSRILTLPHDARALRRRAKRVRNIQSPEVMITVQAMKHLAIEWESKNPGRRCEGLAATQIGVSLRILIVRATDEQSPVNPDLVPKNTEVYKTENEYLAAHHAHREFWKKNPDFNPFRVLINPVFVTSEGMQDSEESCLSVPGVVGTTIRPEKVIFHYTDERGQRVPAIGPNPEKRGELVAEGFSAACITHEFDHLNGVLMIDSAFKTRPSALEEKIL